MSFFKKREYSESLALEELTDRVANSVEELNDARLAKWKILYSSIELEHLAGKCRKLDGAIQFHTKLDYLILIHKPPFIGMDKLAKLRVLCHELYHIEAVKKGQKIKFKIRKHGGDFCEIAEHDKFSYGLATTAAEVLGIK